MTVRSLQHQRRMLIAQVETWERRKAEREPPVPELLGGYRGPVPVDQLVERDPCWWCGVRRDVGCRHHPLETTRAVAA